VNRGVSDKQIILRNVTALYEEKGIQVSAFGLGNDFDEELMKGIAEQGIGAYFFIDDAASIPNFVSFALSFLQNMVGADATLKVKGVNSGLVTKFYGNHDTLKGAKLGDLRADNVRTLMVKMEVKPLPDTQQEQIMECELTYTAANQPVVVKQTVSMHFTHDAEEVEKNKNPEVQVWAVLQKSSKFDKKLITAMQEDNTEKAIELQKEQVSLLEGVVEIDTAQLGGRNKIAELLKKAKEELAKLEENGVTKNAQKEAHHRYYMVRRG